MPDQVRLEANEVRDWLKGVLDEDVRREPHGYERRSSTNHDVEVNIQSQREVAQLGVVLEAKPTLYQSQGPSLENAAILTGDSTRDRWVLKIHQGRGVANATSGVP